MKKFKNNENDQKLRKLFEALDSDHNGYIDKKRIITRI